VLIQDKDGRPRSIRTPEEEVGVLSEDIGHLPEGERQALMEMYAQLQAGEKYDLEQVANVEYESPPVDIRTFLSEPYFLGESGGALWPALQDDLVELFEGDYYEAAFGGALGVGKTYIATTALSYVLYQMSCLKDPQRAYGIAPGSHIYMAMLSVTERVARRVPINELLGKITHSRYFKEKFPSKAAPSLLEIRFPNQIMIVAGSTGSSAMIGLNVFSGFIDEVSFLGTAKDVDRMGRLIVTDRGEVIYKSIVRRMKSRFQKIGRLPGLMILASSKERPTAFIEKRIEQAREEKDPHFFVRDRATWQVKPAGDFTDETFKVAVGNEKHHSRILDGSRDDEEKKYLDLGLQVIEVPLEYKPDFERDLEGSLRDIAGFPTLAVSPYINRTEKIFEAVDDTLPNPMEGLDKEDIQEEWVADTILDINWNRIAVQSERRIQGGYTETFWRPLRHPDVPRYAHIDPSLSGDATGLVIAHIAGWTEVVRRDRAGEEYNETAPLIETDLVLRILPPPGDEILLSDVRAIIYQFMDHGFSVRYVTLDQYQSADAIQQFKKRGMESELLSVDKTTQPYDLLKTTLYEGRIRMHRHAWCQRELTQLQRVPKPRGKGYKIDHPQMGPDGKPGTKDIADALAATTFNLTQRIPGIPIPIQSSASADTRVLERDDVDHSWVTDGKSLIKQESGKETSGGGIVGTRPEDPGNKPMPFIKG